MISEVELALLRVDSIGYMPETINVYTPTEARSASGGTTYTFPANPTTSYFGRLAPMSKSRKTWYADKLGGRQGWTISLPWDASVNIKSRLGLGTRRFEIIGTNAARTYQITYMLDCVEVL